VHSKCVDNKIGLTFGLLKIISFNDVKISICKTGRINYFSTWNAECICGFVVIRSIKQLSNGDKLHCGHIKCKRRITKCSWRKKAFTDLQAN
jgi:hypothetical protein